MFQNDIFASDPNAFKLICKFNLTIAALKLHGIVISKRLWTKMEFVPFNYVIVTDCYGLIYRINFVLSVFRIRLYPHYLQFFKKKTTTFVHFSQKFYLTVYQQYEYQQISKRLFSWMRKFFLLSCLFLFCQTLLIKTNLFMDTVRVLIV